MSKKFAASTAYSHERPLDCIIYYIKPNQIDVLAVIHCAQNIGRLT